MSKEVVKLKEALNSLSQLSYSTSSSKRQSQQLEVLQQQVKQLQNQLTVSERASLLGLSCLESEQKRQSRGQWTPDSTSRVLAVGWGDASVPEKGKSGERQRLTVPRPLLCHSYLSVMVMPQLWQC